MTQIKICGITREEEIAYLNEAEVSYAGFVFYEKSKRYLPVEEAKKIKDKLNKDIKKVAVTVSPTIELTEQITAAGFDILQIHGEFDESIYSNVNIPIWRAINLSSTSDLRRWRSIAAELGKCDAILIDAGDFGSGKTFGWDASDSQGEDKKMERQKQVSEAQCCQQAWMKEFAAFKRELAEQNTSFILAGGLTPINVAEGIRIFQPDAVDVSSGVETITYGQRGKSRELIRAFVDAVSNA